uniref:Uncharacterized protein n=1 Tax=Ascaris lumbricoides TaxID=6252 RepID=A0A9J2Q6P8_ASCLU
MEFIWLSVIIEDFIMSGGCFILMLLLASTLRAVSSHVNSVQSNQRFTMHTALSCLGEVNGETVPYKLLHIGNITMIACSLVLLCNNCSKKKNAEPQKRSIGNERQVRSSSDTSKIMEKTLKVFSCENVLFKKALKPMKVFTQTKKKFNDQRMKKQTRKHSNNMADCEVRTSSADPFDVVNMELRKLSEEKNPHTEFSLTERPCTTIVTMKLGFQRTHRKHKHHHRKHHHKKRRSKSKHIDDSGPCSSTTKKERGMHVSLNETSITYNEGMSKTLEGLKPREFVKGAKEIIGRDRQQRICYNCIPSDGSHFVDKTLLLTTKLELNTFCHLDLNLTTITGVCNTDH